MKDRAIAITAQSMYCQIPIASSHDGPFDLTPPLYAYTMSNSFTTFHNQINFHSINNLATNQPEFSHATPKKTYVQKDSAVDLHNLPPESHLPPNRHNSQKLISIDSARTQNDHQHTHIRQHYPSYQNTYHNSYPYRPQSNNQYHIHHHNQHQSQHTHHAPPTPHGAAPDQKSRAKAESNLKKDIIEFADAYINLLFQCEQSPPPTSHIVHIDHVPSLPHLTNFVAYVLQRTRISSTTLVLALFYLRRLKLKNPICKGSYGSGHRMILASLIVASKYLFDDTYDNKAWAQVSQGLFSIGEVNRMEIELLKFLDYQLVFQENEWLEFVAEIDHRIGVKRGHSGVEERRVLRKEMCKFIRSDQVTYSKGHEGSLHNTVANISAWHP